MKQLLSILLVACCFSACKAQNKTFTAPDSDLGHIDIIVDSLTFQSILQDSFLGNEFAVLEQDTTMYSKPSYDIYMLGQQAFLHVSLAKEYWQNKSGSGSMIFQTRKPDKVDSLYSVWKRHHKDSLGQHTFNGANFDLGEVYPYRKKDSLKIAEPNFMPILTSYSAMAYSNWGFDDSVINDGLSMKEFMTSWDSNSQSKLFKKIKALHLQLTKQEYSEMASALLAMGYKKRDNGFFHEFNPVVHYTITKTNMVPKYTKIEIELNASTTERIIQLGNMYTVYVNGRDLVIEQKK